AGPKPRPDRGVRSVVYRRAHGSAHFHAADLDRRLGGAGGGHGGCPAWLRHPYRRGAPAVHPVWAMRRDGDAARGDFLDFDEKAINGSRKSVTIHLAHDRGALTRKIVHRGLRRRSSHYCAVVDAPKPLSVFIAPYRIRRSIGPDGSFAIASPYFCGQDPTCSHRGKPSQANRGPKNQDRSGCP